MSPMKHWHMLAIVASVYSVVLASLRWLRCIRKENK